VGRVKWQWQVLVAVAEIGESKRVKVKGQKTEAAMNYQP